MEGLLDLRLEVVLVTSLALVPLRCRDLTLRKVVLRLRRIHVFLVVFFIVVVLAPHFCSRDRSERRFAVVSLDERVLATCKLSL